jgi:hypothetical protein
VGGCRSSGGGDRQSLLRELHVGNIDPDNVLISVVSEGVRAYAVDSTNAEALWKKSEELVGESF